MHHVSKLYKLVSCLRTVKNKRKVNHILLIQNANQHLLPLADQIILPTVNNLSPSLSKQVLMWNRAHFDWRSALQRISTRWILLSRSATAFGEILYITAHRGNLETSARKGQPLQTVCFGMLTIKIQATWFRHEESLPILDSASYRLPPLHYK